MNSRYGNIYTWRVVPLHTSCECCHVASFYNIRRVNLDSVQVVSRFAGKITDTWELSESIILLIEIFTFKLCAGHQMPMHHYHLWSQHQSYLLHSALQAQLQPLPVPLSQGQVSLESFNCRMLQKWLFFMYCVKHLQEADSQWGLKDHWHARWQPAKAPWCPYSFLLNLFWDIQLLYIRKTKKHTYIEHMHPLQASGSNM